MKINQYSENTISSMRYRRVYEKTHSYTIISQNLKITVWLGSDYSLTR